MTQHDGHFAADVASLILRQFGAALPLLKSNITG